MIVLDASAALELVLRSAAGDAVAKRIRRPAVSLHAPHLIDLEVTRVLRRYLHMGKLEEAVASRALIDFRQLDLARYSHEPLLGRVWALRGNITAYDAAYVALAEVLDAALVTCDERLAAAPGHRARIEIVRP